MEFKEFDSFVVLDCGAFGSMVYDFPTDKVTVNFDSEIPFDDLMRLMKVLKRKVNQIKKQHIDLDI